MREWLRQIRRIKGMTGAEVAKQVGISQPFYHQIEVGLRDPSPTTAQAIALVLGFDWTLFFPPKKKIG